MLRPGKQDLSKEEYMNCVVIGGSAGSSEVLQEIYQRLSPEFSLPIVICQHVHANAKTSARGLFAVGTKHKIKEAEEKEPLLPGLTYLAPANYHLLIERDFTLALNIDNPECYCRPSINVLFETAARTFGQNLIGILLSGANDDGARGLNSIKNAGGLTVVQEPASAAYSEMPERALNFFTPDFIFTPAKIADLLNTQARGEPNVS